MNTFCATCGMPLDKKEDIGLTDERGSFCRYCVDKNGKLKSTELIFNGGVSFFMHAIPGTSIELAEKITRKNMRSLPYWKESTEPCLMGEIASDEEYVKAMKSLEQ